MAVSLPYAVALFCAGYASHLVYFKHGEHHLYGVRYIQCLLLAGITAIGYQTTLSQFPLATAARTTTIYTSICLAGLFTSVLIYRVFLSPLRRFHGPLGCAISSFYISFRLRKMDAYRQVQKLHKQYGDIVRVGSNDLSIIDPKAVNVIYGLGSKCVKGVWYDLALPLIGISSARDPHLHAQRRKDWNPAFNAEALRNYESRLLPYQDMLVARLKVLEGKEVDITKWFEFYSFDIMGDLAYGKSFGMLDKDEYHWAVQLQIDGLATLGFMFPIWFFRTLIAIPGITKDFYRFRDFGTEKLEERMAAQETIPDIMTSLLAPWKERKPTEFEFDLLKGDSQTIIVAGSDTSYTALAYIFYYLVKHPEHVEKLREDLKECPDFSHRSLQGLQHLNGIIYEALRLWPPVPTSQPRVTPPEGIQIGSTHIPGGVTVWASQYILGRSTAVYVRPEEFIPERWYSKPELVLEKSAWAPFSKGEYGCIGRPLALMSLRMVTAKLFTAFDMSFANEKTADDVLKAKDHFTLAPGSLKVVLKERKV